MACRRAPCCGNVVAEGFLICPCCDALWTFHGNEVSAAAAGVSSDDVVLRTAAVAAVRWIECVGHTVGVADDSVEG